MYINVYQSIYLERWVGTFHMERERKKRVHTYLCVCGPVYGDSRVASSEVEGVW